MNAAVRSGQTILAALPGLLPDLVAYYLDLHAHPELSGAEQRTAAELSVRLAGAGFAVTEGVGGHGVVGVLSNGDGPTVMLRAELDALPVREQTGLRYASAARGVDADGRPVPVMHACGHDLHLAAVVGAARLLAAGAARWRGTLVVIGQPAEETLTGARAMLDDGLLDRFGRPDVLLAQHSAPLPAGMVAHGEGPLLAGSVSLEIVVPGRGGHAGSPHLAIDPIVTAAAIVLRLHAIVSREVGAAEQVVLTVGSIHAGGASNVVPDRATLGVTVRAHSPQLLVRVTAAIARIVTAECAASGCPAPPEIREVSRSPVTVADRAVVAAVRAGHEELLGAQRIAYWPPSMATEDVAHFAAAGVPCAYWMFGVVGATRWAEAPGATAAEKLAALPANHSPRFAPDVATALPAGVRAMVAAALTQLAQA